MVSRTMGRANISPSWSNRPRPKGRAKASSCDDRSRTFAAAPCHGAKLARDWPTTLRTFKNRPRAIQNRQPPETPRHGVFDREPGRRLQPFFPRMSFSAALSSIDPANSFFSRPVLILQRLHPPCVRYFHAAIFGFPFNGMDGFLSTIAKRTSNAIEREVTHEGSRTRCRLGKECLPVTRC